MVPVPSARQREALAFLEQHLFAAGAFQWPPALLNKLAPERHWDFTGSVFRARRIDFPVHEMVLAIQRRPLNRFYDSTFLSRLQDLELRYDGEEDPFTMQELFARLRAAIWSELETGTSISSFRRNLQREHLRHLTRLVLAPTTTPEDARSLARADLKVLDEDVGKALGNDTIDAYTGAHLDEVKTRIEAALAAAVNRAL